MATLAPPTPLTLRSSVTVPIPYPESDGRPMADNTLQFQWIVAIHNGLEALFKDDANVFVAGDLLWYPVEGDPKTRVAPDVLVVFGRPPGQRGSYLQWQEGNLPPQVVFEILSPGNTLPEMVKKLRFYERFGVEEYYLYDPHSGDLSGWLRTPTGLEVIDSLEGWISPRLKIKFALENGELALYRPDGRRFESYTELMERAEHEYVRAEAQTRRAERFAEKLRALGVDPDTV